MVVRRILGAVVAGALAVVGWSAAPAVADASSIRTFATDIHGWGELCHTAGEVTYASGVITIDISKLATDVTEVVIATGSLSGCIDKVTSLAWTGTHPLAKLTVQNSAFSQNGIVNTLASVTFPGGLENLQIGQYAFWQNAGPSAGSNSLASVTFPDGLRSLSIGTAAFQQLAASGDNALTSVAFPSTLTSLAISTYAFHQEASGSNALASVKLAGEMTSLTVDYEAFYQYAGIGDNALSSVSFPPSLTVLTLGPNVFAQSAPSGQTALASIDFPATLMSLNIGDLAFKQYSTTVGGTSLRTVRFPGSLNTLTVGQDAFRQQDGGASALTSVILERTAAWTTTPTLTVGANAFAGGAEPTWYWFGPDGVRLDDAWNGSISGLSVIPSLVGYRTLVFDVGPGASGQGTWYVYRGGSHTTTPRVLRSIAAGDWTVSGLPTASRDGYTLASWCATAASPCASPLAVGASHTVDTASKTLYANWSVSPSVVVSTLAEATVGTPYAASVASGAGLTCSVISGALPTGLSLSGCSLAGTPMVAGLATFTVKASNSAGSPSSSLTLVVRNSRPAVTTSVLPAATVTVPYTAKITVSGSGSISCGLKSGSLPPGLLLKGCVISGTPTHSGSYPLTVAAANDAGSASKALTLTVAAAKKFTNVYKPKISGKARVGRTLKAKVKTWKPKPTTTTWQWKRNGVAIPGATKSTYKLTKADKGAKITVTTVRSRIGYQSSSTSKATARVK